MRTYARVASRSLRSRSAPRQPPATTNVSPPGAARCQDEPWGQASAVFSMVGALSRWLVVAGG